MRMLVRFGKNARLRFISHLDLQRFLHMALNRTGLPIKYSEGFNPHPLMAFGSALALGWTSEYELLDVRLSAPMGRKKCEEAMRFALPEELPVLEIKLLEDRAPSVMAQVYASDYHISLSGEAAEAVKAEAERFLKEESVLAVKKTKSGEKEINIRPLALRLESCADGLNARLMLTEKDALKADLLVKTLAERAGVEPPEMRIHRVCLLAKDAQGALRPVMEL